MSRRSRTSGRARLIRLGVVIVLVTAPGVFWIGTAPAATQSVDVVPPSHADLETASRLRIFFGHQSVGANILDGLDAVTGAGGVSTDVVEARVPRAGAGPFVAHATVGVNGDPLGKLAVFADLLKGPMGDAVDVALVKLCYLDVVADTDVHAVFDAYVETMSDLEGRRPQVRFVYTTVPLTTDRGRGATVRAWFGVDDAMGPADNVARERYNSLVRARYAGTGRLFDVAAVEATLAQRPTRRSHDGEEYFVLNRSLSADAGHLNDAGSRAAAAELVRVVAASVR